MATYVLDTYRGIPRTGPESFIDCHVYSMNSICCQNIKETRQNSDNTDCFIKFTNTEKGTLVKYTRTDTDIQLRCMARIFTGPIPSIRTVKGN